MNNERLSKLTMRLKCENGEILGFNKFSLLQGVIMEHIDKAYAEVLHEDWCQRKRVVQYMQSG